MEIDLLKTVVSSLSLEVLRPLHLYSSELLLQMSETCSVYSSSSSCWWFMKFICKKVDIDFINRNDVYALQDTVDVNASPEELFEMLSGNDLSQWLLACPDMKSISWTSVTPHGVGSTRSVVLSFMTVEEECLLWEEGKRLAFCFTTQNLPMNVSGVENYQLEELDGGSRTRLHGAMYLQPTMLGKMVNEKKKITDFIVNTMKGIQKYVDWKKSNNSIPFPRHMLSRSTWSMKRRLILAFTLPALCLLIPFLIITLMVHTVDVLVKRMLGYVLAPSPNEKEDINNVEATSSVLSRIESTGAYVGDFLGFLANASGWIRQHNDSGRMGPVFGTNKGCPVVACMDRASAEVLLRDVNIDTVKHRVNLHFSFKGLQPNFVQCGAGARAIRTFILSVLPKSPTDPKFVVAISAMKATMGGWTSPLRTRELVNMKLEDAIAKLIQVFAQTLFFGQQLDQALVDAVFPVPYAMPAYSLFPVVLLPQFHVANAAMGTIAALVRTCAYWPSIKEAAQAARCPEGVAIKALFSAITFNPMGLSCSMLNALYMLSLLPEQGKELMRDEALLDSFAWELIRHNGPPIMRDVESDTEIPTSGGKRYKVKKGTTLLAHLNLAQRDPTVWAEPHVFRADRFVASPEPLPTLGFGCPLGAMHDEAQHQNSHQCAFLHLCHPFLKAYITLLVEAFSWELNEACLSAAKHCHIVDNAVTSVLRADLSVEVINAQGFSKDMVPRVQGREAFARFSLAPIPPPPRDASGIVATEEAEVAADERQRLGNGERDGVEEGERTRDPPRERLGSLTAAPKPGAQESVQINDSWAPRRGVQIFPESEV